MFSIKRFLALAALSSLSLSADASVITFDGLGGTNMPGNGQVYDVYGVGQQTYFFEGQPARVGQFDFTATTGALLFTPVNANDPTGRSYFAWNGTDYLVAVGVRMTSSTALPFSVKSVDLAGWAGAMDVFISGTKADGTVVSTLFSGPDTNRTIANDFNTYTLTGFSDLKSLSISSRAGWLAIDDIAIADSNNVPEPASLAILGLGLAGIGAARRRTR